MAAIWAAIWAEVLKRGTRGWARGAFCRPPQSKGLPQKHLSGLHTSSSHCSAAPPPPKRPATGRPPGATHLIVALQRRLYQQRHGAALREEKGKGRGDGWRKGSVRLQLGSATGGGWPPLTHHNDTFPYLARPTCCACPLYLACLHKLPAPNTMPAPQLHKPNLIPHTCLPPQSACPPHL